MAQADELQDLTDWLRWSRWVLAVVALISIAAGVIVLVEPSISLATLAVVTGAFMLADGLTNIVLALVRGDDQRVLTVLIGMLDVVIGVILIRHPIRGIVAVALLLGLWLIVSGIVRLVGSIAQERRPAWAQLVALIELVAGILIVSDTSLGVKTLALIIGIGLIIRGVTMAAIAWAAWQAAGSLGDAPADPGAVRAT